MISDQAPRLRRKPPFLGLLAASVLASLALSACSNGTSDTTGTTFPSPTDTFGAFDIGAFDAGPSDSLATDTAATDASSTDASSTDTSSTDTSTPSTDTVSPDAGTSCADPCEPEGGARCTDNGLATQTCADPDSDGCFQWSDPTACSPTEVCADGGCLPKCPDQDCTSSGAKKCDPAGKVVTCFDFNGDGCLGWGGAKSCPGTNVCANGFCALSCKDACTTVGAKKCEGKATVVCGDHDKDGCLDWGSKSACGAAQACSSGFCADTCKDECTSKGATKCDAAGVLSCDDYNKDGCLQWGTAVACSTGKKCSSGVCAATCKDECTVKAATACQVGKVVTCGDFNKDGCLQWGSAVACAAGLVCAEGKCEASCTNECTVKGAKQCSAAGKLQECGDFNSDGCLQWGSETACAATTVCSNGQCAATCKDACD